jgi:hypothetical protein
MRTNESRELKVELTEKEKLEYGQKVARECQLLAGCEEEKAEASSGFTARIKVHKAEINSLSTVLQQGYEYRQVKCERIIDYKKGTLVVIRLDTGEVVQERELNEAEKQRNLPIEPTATAGPEDKPTIEV